jgi:hypothetical protein
MLYIKFIKIHFHVVEFICRQCVRSEEDHKSVMYKKEVMD